MKPVAWMNPNTIKHGIIDAREYKLEGFIPLYTHPVKDDGLLDARSYLIGYEDGKAVKVKELTDEEMMKAEYEFLTWNRSLNNRLVEIAYELPVFQKVMAILRKAQEK